MWRLKIGEFDGNDPYLFSTNNFFGRQTWEFDPDASGLEERAEVEEARKFFYENRFKVKPGSDLIFRLQFLRDKKFRQTVPKVKVEDKDDPVVTHEIATTALKRAVCFYSAFQANDGQWPAQHAGPLFYNPLLIISLYLTSYLNVVLSTEHRKELLRYTYNHQNEDGGWGIDIVSQSTMFCTTLNYVSLRLLGEKGPNIDSARKWILDHGGATGIPSWGKACLSMLGLYDWSGCNPLPPEYWLCPSFLPIHPKNVLCFCRSTYMPLSYLYGKRFVCPITPFIEQLREEIYNQPYKEINWNKSRYECAKEDLYHHPPLIQKLLWDSFYTFVEPLLTRWPWNKLRQRALQVSMKHIHYEDETTRYIAIGWVIKALCMVACWVDDPNGDCFRKHISRLQDYFWVGEDGMTLQGNMSATWDTAFAIQTLFASHLNTDEMGPILMKAHEFIKKSQVNLIIITNVLDDPKFPMWQ